MTAEKTLTLFKALRRATEDGRVTWEGTAAENVFRAWVGEGMVKIGEYHAPPADDGEPGQTYYRAWVLNGRDEVVDAVEEWPSSTGFAALEPLFTLARRHARGADQVVDNMLRQLEAMK